MHSKLPTLTNDKILDNEKLIIEKLYEYFLASEYSQTSFYVDNIASLKYLIATNPIEDSPTDLETNIKDTLKNMYIRYFDEVEIFCSVNVQQNEVTVYDINIDIHVTNNSNEFKLNRIINIVNNKINFLKTHQILLYK